MQVLFESFHLGVFFGDSLSKKCDRFQSSFNQPLKIVINDND